MGLTESQPESFRAAVLYEDQSFREPLKAAVATAGGVVSTELRLSSFRDLAELTESILVVNLEPLLLRRPEVLEAVLDFPGRLVLNDAEASARLTGSARARWARHLAAKITGRDNVFPPQPESLEARDPLAPDAEPASPELWILAASIGGPEALRSFLGALQPNLPFCLVLAQHIGPEFITLMAEQLDQASRIAVRVALDGEAFRPGRVYVIPPNCSFRVSEDQRVVLTPREVTTAYAPDIDQVIRDAVGRFGDRVHVIVFSGMASDAVDGSALVMETGGEVWVQDPATCVVSSMVDGALQLGEVSYLADPLHLAHRLNQRGIELH